MKVLVVKTSSLGDIIHTLPALTDATNYIPNIQFDWVLETNFQEIPSWHPQVRQVIPLAWRRWRKQFIKAYRSGEIKAFWQQLRQEHYDLIIDAQGLLKSAILSRLCRGAVRAGPNWESAREPLACFAYERCYATGRISQEHAITRIRRLFAAALSYPLPTTVADYGLDRNRLGAGTPASNYVVFLHATTWPTKHWPELYWNQLADCVVQAGYEVYLPWGSQAEQERAQRLAQQGEQRVVLPRLSLKEIAKILVNAKAVVTVDTGLGHLASALAVPTLSLYGPTNPDLTGTMGAHQHPLRAHFKCAPCLQEKCRYQGPREVEPACFASIPPHRVWEYLRPLLT